MYTNSNADVLLRNKLRQNNENAIYSIGYSGKTLKDFMGILTEYNITRVIDIRMNSFSWKIDFRNKIFETNMEKINIKYVHIKNLGAPKEIREEIKSRNNPDKFFAEYRKWVIKNRISFEYLLDISQYERSIILCVEEDYKLCHRKVIMDKMKRHGFRVHNL